jgi:hypothetical protein
MNKEIDFEFEFSEFSDFNDFIDKLPKMDFDFNLDFNLEKNTTKTTNDSKSCCGFLKDIGCLKDMFSLKGLSEFLNTEKLNKLYESLTMNYKSWILVLLSLFLISKQTKKRFSISLVTFIISIVVAHYVHNNVHHKIEEGQSRPNLNILHLYHHEHDNILSHIIQIILEFVSGVYVIFVKHIANLLSIPVLNFIDNWVILFTYIFYTIVHNINYGFFKVNDVHKNHHINMTKNMGPDICDILFDTKYEDTPEQHDHYIPTILFTYFFVSFLRTIWRNLTYFRTPIVIILYSIFILCFIFLGLSVYYIIFTKNFKQDDDIYKVLSNLEKNIKK